MSSKRGKVDKVRSDSGQSTNNRFQGTTKMTGRKRANIDLKVPQIRLRRLSSEELSMPPVEMEQTRKVHLAKKTLLKGTSSENKCKICGKIFAGYTSLYNHVRFLHLNPNSFKCSLCPRAFNYKYLLDTHKQRCHKDTWIYNCGQCNFRVDNKVSFDKHVVKCEAKNNPPKASRMSLGSHSKRISLQNDGQKGEKESKPSVELSCPSCKMTCDNRTALFNHLKQHQNEICSEDSKITLPRENLGNNGILDTNPNLHGIQDVTASQKSAEDSVNEDDCNGTNKPMESHSKSVREISRKPSERIRNRRLRKGGCSWKNGCCGAEHSKKPVTDNPTQERERENVLNKPTTSNTNRKHSNSGSLELTPYVVVEKMPLESISKVELRNSIKCKTELNSKSRKTLKEEFDVRSKQPLTRKLTRSFTGEEDLNNHSNEEECSGQSQKPLKPEPTDDTEPIQNYFKQTSKLLIGDISSAICSDILTECNTMKTRTRPNVPKPVPDRLKNYKCNYCDKEFIRNINLTDHIAQVHNAGHFPSKCDSLPIESTKAIAVKSELKVEYENQCHLCFVTCWNATALVNHLKRHDM